MGRHCHTLFGTMKRAPFVEKELQSCVVPLGLAHCMMLRGQVLLESVLRDLGVAVLSGFWLQDATGDSDPK